ncbi:hypothetical protein [Bacillus sonorensis]|uniref:hypothetical protein n=1 Tax=Bacillus sonorensis TaxID=119858 RepID=UPI002DB5B441|nr:hypothetical protein [Bacillus sonorensis]MEC0342019.1 hypothetical protein [Bacillus sonorensis]MEC0457467.1 hypothetical protein [Bacillus sonorensis]MEC0530738.1 hypothetical protein [Bacillus sonorensis]
MTDFIVNEAGAKIYKDIAKHEILKVPVLLDEKEKGVVHLVLSVGFRGSESTNCHYQRVKQRSNSISFALRFTWLGRELYDAKITGNCFVSC